MAKIKILFSKVLRFRPLRNKRNKEKDKKRDPKIVAVACTEPNRTEPTPTQTEPNATSRMRRIIAETSWMRRMAGRSRRRSRRRTWKRRKGKEKEGKGPDSEEKGAVNK